MYHLVGAVKERELLLASDETADLFPLVGSGIHPGWVVSAGVQEDNGTRRSCAKVFKHAWVGSNAHR
jgi:hypothetical protein